MFARVLWRSILERKARTFVATFAVAVAATTVSAVLHLDGDVRQRMTEEVRAYGPNLVVYPRGESHPLVVGGVDLGGSAARRAISEDGALAAVSALPPGAKSVRVRGGGVVARGEPASAIALPWKEAMALCPWWMAEGEAREEASSCLIGVDLAKHWKPHIVTLGEEIEIDGRPTRVAGLLSTGGAEDRQIVLSEAEGARRFQDGYAAIWVRMPGTARDVEACAAAIERQVPDVAARPVRQVSEAEGQVLDRVRGLLLYICLAVLAASGLCVMTTMLATAADREREMALLVALGAGPRRIAALTLGQAGGLGLVGGAVGFVLGWAVARVLGMEIFHVPARMAWGLLAPVLGASVALCLVGALAPLRRALSLAPAAVLKGE